MYRVRVHGDALKQNNLSDFSIREVPRVEREYAKNSTMWRKTIQGSGRRRK
jgi:hypothetical protein